MSEMPYWPRVEICTTVNGFIVRPAPDFSRDTVGRVDETVYVFTDWPSCSNFLATVTEPRRPGDGSGDRS